MSDERRTTIDSWFLIHLLIFTGLFTAAAPRIKRRFATQEPIIFPREISALFSNASPTETASSGYEVPNPIITAETIKTGIPNLSAIFDVPSTRISEPLISMIIPIINIGIAKRSGIIFNQ